MANIRQWCTLADLHFTFELKGTDKVQAKIVAALQSMSGKAEAALYQEAERIMTEAKKRTPVEFGTLKNSGHVQPPEREANSVSVTMGFGGSAEDYAIVQHEDLSFHHNVGEAKFLENPIREAAPHLLERIASRIKL